MLMMKKMKLFNKKCIAKINLMMKIRINLIMKEKLMSMIYTPNYKI